MGVESPRKRRHSCSLYIYYSALHLGDLNASLLVYFAISSSEIQLFNLSLRLLSIDVTLPTASGSGVNFMPLSPPLEERGIKPWADDLELEFVAWLECETVRTRAF